MKEYHDLEKLMKKHIDHRVRPSLEKPLGKLRLIFL